MIWLLSSAISEMWSPGLSIAAMTLAAADDLATTRRALASTAALGAPPAVLEQVQRRRLQVVTVTPVAPAGRTAAKKDGVEHLVHKKDGTVGARNSYGKDPHPPKG